jgi:lariat debranching enzyme
VRAAFCAQIAVEGCCHGELDTIYAAMQRLEAKEGVKIDLLICCGDFQAVRNEDDLACMSVPDKYKVLGTFYKARVWLGGWADEALRA